MTYTELKAYASEKYACAKWDYECWCKTYCIIDTSLECRMLLWYAATRAKDKQTLIARIKMAAYSTEELRFANAL